jgi:hypothetical protein
MELLMIGMLGTLALGAAKTLVLSMLSEKIILKLTLEILEWAVKRSSNTIDDKIVLMMRERLQETGVI